MSETSYKIFILFAAAGIALSIYHAYSELTEVFTGCNLSAHVSCGLVFQTGYTTIAVGGVAIPFWIFGVIWFPLMLILGLALWKGRRLLLLPILLVGDMFTIYLWYVEIAKVWPAAHALCPVCVSLYVINYILTGIAAISIDYS